MSSLAYFDDQPKYFTRITEFEYFRPTPGSNANQTPTNFITLPLPDNMPDDAFSAGIRDKDMYELGSSIDVIKSGFSTASTFEQLATSATGIGIAGIVASALRKSPLVGDLAAGLVGASAAIEFGGAYLGMTRNPHTALIFDRMGLRHFNLTYKLSPRNNMQSRRLDTILNTLKLGMHPSYNKDAKAFVLDYPKLYKIEFANLNYNGIPKIDFSFLKSMSISASPQGQVLYKDGYPAFVDVRLEFSEIDMKTRDYFTGAGLLPSTPPNDNPNNPGGVGDH